MQFKYNYGATPIDPDEAEGLIPKHLITMNELNEWEATNILEAEKWFLKRRPQSPEDVLDVNYLCKLHKKMFDNTWKWAGKFRQSNKNIGSDKSMVMNDTKHLLDDIQYYLQNKTYFLQEIALRFHHRLVQIHLFPNGNGRHARLITEILQISLNIPRFTWGENLLFKSNLVREQYIQALRIADKDRDYKPLMNFAIS